MILYKVESGATELMIDGRPIELSFESAGTRSQSRGPWPIPTQPPRLLPLSPRHCHCHIHTLHLLPKMKYAYSMAACAAMGTLALAHTAFEVSAYL